MAKPPKKLRVKYAAPPLPKVTEAMREFSALLGTELQTWPQITTRPMFGFTAFYREDRIFAALPKTRALVKGDAFMFKLLSPAASVRKRIESDPRIVPTDFTDSKWFAMEVFEERDLRDALAWLERAYQAAR
jgi:hypothetical protein